MQIFLQNKMNLANAFIGPILSRLNEIARLYRETLRLGVSLPSRSITRSSDYPLYSPNSRA